MERTALVPLAEWKARGEGKALIIRGARQVGKTWLMRRSGAESHTRHPRHGGLAELPLDALSQCERLLPSVRAGTVTPTGRPGPRPTP